MEQLNQQETERLAMELLEAAGDLGLREEEAQKAIEEVNAITVNAALLENWRKGLMSLSWSVPNQEIEWKITEAGKAEVEKMLSDPPIDGNRRRGD